ncbi:hypothetical protein LIA77_08035 [Sarocladium implicatum]|nr:hypothetical protein LIA77_08035 [Sarocladium implicatum]
MASSMIVTGWPIPHRPFNEEVTDIFNTLPLIYPTPDYTFMVPRNVWILVAGFQGSNDRALWARFCSFDQSLPFVTMNLYMPGLNSTLEQLVHAGEGMKALYEGVEFAFMDKAIFPDLQWRCGPVGWFESLE